MIFLLQIGNFFVIYDKDNFLLRKKMILLETKVWDRRIVKHWHLVYTLEIILCHFYYPRKIFNVDVIYIGRFSMDCVAVNHIAHKKSIWDLSIISVIAINHHHHISVYILSGYNMSISASSALGDQRKSLPSAKSLFTQKYIHMYIFDSGKSHCLPAI